MSALSTSARSLWSVCGTDICMLSGQRNSPAFVENQRIKGPPRRPASFLHSPFFPWDVSVSLRPGSLLDIRTGKAFFFPCQQFMSVVSLQGSAVTTILPRWPRRHNCHVAIFPCEARPSSELTWEAQSDRSGRGRYIMRKSAVWKWGHDSFLVESRKKTKKLTPCTKSSKKQYGVISSYLVGLYCAFEMVGRWQCWRGGSLELALKQKI